MAVERETIRLAFVAALQHLPPRQRAVLILAEVLRWQASEIAELLETSVASVNSALQRARATIEAAEIQPAGIEADDGGKVDNELLERYVAAFEAYDIVALTSLIREDASQSMPPFDMWLAGRDDILAWWFGPGIGCQGSRVIPTRSANGSPAFGQYKPSPDGGYEPWALQVLELSGDRIGEFTFFLDTDRLFPLFGLPARLDALVAASSRRPPEDVGEAHEGDQLDQVVRRVQQPQAPALTAAGELKQPERLDADRIGAETLDVADREVGHPLLHEGDDAHAQGREVLAAELPADRDGDRSRRSGGHLPTRPAPR